MTDGLAPVLVGVDGSAGGRGALRWAADEAARFERQLDIVCAVETNAPAGWATRADTAVADAIDLAHAEHPDLDVVGTVVRGTVSDVLAERAKRAARLVIASHVVIGSALGVRLPCPVLVVHDARQWASLGTALPRSGPILVGVNGSLASHRALRMGFGEAAARQAPLEAVRVTSAATPLNERLDQAEQLGGDVDLWRAVFPGVRSDVQVVLGDPAAVLGKLSLGALITVIGAHGGDSVVGVRLGSVTQRVLLDAAGPVLVVPA
jgi:nucleotide-binding universal stress UspA family protein